MADETFRSTWRALSAEERRFVRALADLGEPAGTRAGNSLVAAYAGARLRRLHIATQALVTSGWVAYLVVAFTVLREAPTPLVSSLAVAFATAQATCYLRAEHRLQRAIAVNR